MATRFKHRTDTASNWTAANPVLLAGEFGYEAGTKKLKVGDGVTAWTALPYQAPDEVALTATYVTYVDSVTGLPLVGKHVIITVDQTTDDIADIVVEDI